MRPFIPSRKPSVSLSIAEKFFRTDHVNVYPDSQHSQSRMIYSRGFRNRYVNPPLLNKYFADYLSFELKKRGINPGGDKMIFVRAYDLTWVQNLITGIASANFRIYSPDGQLDLRFHYINRGINRDRGFQGLFHRVISVVLQEQKFRQYVLSTEKSSVPIIGPKSK